MIIVGPPEQAMWALGDKIASTIIAQSANVPTLPWSGSRKPDIGLNLNNVMEMFSFSDLKLEWNEEDHENATVPMNMYQRACVTDCKEGAEVRDPFFLNNQSFDVIIRLLLGLGFP